MKTLTQIYNFMAKIQIRQLVKRILSAYSEVARFTLSDGTDIFVRRATATDSHQLLHMHNRLSSGSLYFRYLSPRRAKLDELKQISNLNNSAGVAYVAQLDDFEKTVIGLAYYVRDNPKSGRVAEPAIVIEDRFQSKGFGTFFFKHLCKRAYAGNVKAFKVHVHPENHKMLRVIDNMSYPSIKRIDSEVVTVTMDLSKITARSRSRKWGFSLFEDCDLGLYNRHYR